MFTEALWWAANFLEILILARAFKAGLIRAYPYFYSYVGFVLLQDLFRFYIYSFKPEQYSRVYWSTEFVGLLFGWGILWEIYRAALVPFPGAVRNARALFCLLWVLVFTKALTNVWGGKAFWPITTTVEMERDLRVIQAALLIALICVFRYYAVALGRNLNGLTRGYGLFLASSVLYLAFRANYGSWFQVYWVYLQPAVYLAVLSIWVHAMWTPYPAISPGTESKMHHDYLEIAAATSRHLGRARASLSRRIRA